MVLAVCPFGEIGSLGNRHSSGNDSPQFGKTGRGAVAAGPSKDASRTFGRSYPPDASGRTLYNHVTTTIGFMSSPDRRVHFGLGHERAVKSIEISWPSGRVQILDDVRPDQVLIVVEPRE
jgi:ASPIC and UnbV